MLTIQEKMWLASQQYQVQSVEKVVLQSMLLTSMALVVSVLYGVDRGCSGCLKGAGICASAMRYWYYSL